MNPPVRGLPWGSPYTAPGKQINNKCRKVVETIANELRAKFDIA